MQFPGRAVEDKKCSETDTFSGYLGMLFRSMGSGQKNRTQIIMIFMINTDSNAHLPSASTTFARAVRGNNGTHIIMILMVTMDSNAHLPLANYHSLPINSRNLTEKPAHLIRNILFCFCRQLFT